MTHQQRGVTHHKITHTRCDTGITQPEQCADMQKKKEETGNKKKRICVRERIRMRGQRGLCQHPTCLTVCSYCGSTGTTRSQKLKSLCACVLTVRRYRARHVQLASSRLWQVHQIFVCGLQKTIADCKTVAKILLCELWHHWDVLQQRQSWTKIYTGGNMYAYSRDTSWHDVYMENSWQMAIKRTLNIYTSHICLWICMAVWTWGNTSTIRCAVCVCVLPLICCKETANKHQMFPWCFFYSSTERDDWRERMKSN